MKDKTFNTIFAGLFGGLLLPLLLLVIIIMVRKDEQQFFGYLSSIRHIGILPKLISICLIPNLLLFFIFIWSNRYSAARGVILSMFITGLVIGILKII